MPAIRFPCRDEVRPQIKSKIGKNQKGVRDIFEQFFERSNVGLSGKTFEQNEQIMLNSRRMIQIGLKEIAKRLDTVFLPDQMHYTNI